MSVPAKQVYEGGRLRDVLLTHVIVDGVATEIVGVGGVPPTPPPPAPTRLLGIYNGPWGENPDAKTEATFGHRPAIASLYYQPNQQALNAAKETTRINAGISPLITLATKGTQRLVGIAGIGSTVAADRAWLDEYLDTLHTLSLVDPNITVRACLESEFDVKVRAGEITGAAADFATYGKALSWFFERGAVRCPNVDLGWWYGGAATQRTNLLTTWKNINSANMGFVCHDPYSQSGSNPANTWASRNADIRTGTYAAEWERLGQPYIGVSETGTNKLSQTDAEMAAWIENIPAAMETADVRFVVYFNRDSGSNGDWRLDGGSAMPRPQAVAAFSQALLEANGY